MMNTPKPTTTPRTTEAATYAPNSCQCENGGSRMKIKLPMIFDWIRLEEEFANAFCSTDIITSPGIRNAV